MTSNSKTDLTGLTENQKGVLKVLADADGETLTGPVARERLRDNYGIDLTMRGMNGVIRRNSNYPRHMVEIKLFKPREDDVEFRHAKHRLKSAYIDTVREQLQ
jgi:hypothetical protein